MDGVVAIVNGVGISEADFDNRNNTLIKGVRDFHLERELMEMWR